MSQDNDDRSLTYPGGFAAIVARMDARRAPLSFAAGEALPPLDVDLAPFKQDMVQPPAPDTVPRPRDQSGHQRKTQELIPQFTGHPSLCLLHAQLIAHLRKSEQPAHSMALFTRIWREEHAVLITHLDPRWLVSAITTFGDHGQTEVQRRVGQSMTVLFSTMKLYESERLYSGLAPEQEFKLKRLVRRKLPLNMDRYALMSGGLDINMLGRLWVDAEQDAVIAPLAHHLLGLLNSDAGTVFRRLATLRGRKARQKAQGAASSDSDPEPAPKSVAAQIRKPSWSTVSTVKASAAQLAPWIAHHLGLGAAQMQIYLDAPLPSDELTALEHPRVTLIPCDDAYWQASGKPRMTRHQQRQAFNATRAYRAASSDWLAHIDCDEYIYSEAPITDALQSAAPEIKALVMPPAEEVAQATESDTALFRRTYFDAGCAKSVIDALYPTFGRYLRSGFISHTAGKTMARTGLPDVRFGVHLLKSGGVEVTEVERAKQLTVLHRHAPDWDSFSRHLNFRLEHGSYRSRDPAQIGLGGIIDVLKDAHGADGPRLLFDEICTARPEALEVLEQHGMLLRVNLGGQPQRGVRE